MIAHPDPPADLAVRRLILRTLTAPLYRIHSAEHHPVYFGRSRRYRFDDPCREYGVLYCAEEEFGAFIETFGQSTGVSVVSVSSLAANPVATLGLERPLSLVDLAASGGLARAGADGRICSGPFDASQTWSRALWEHPAQFDGIAYACRHDTARVAVAVFDRASEAVRVDSTGTLLALEREEKLARILDTYGFGLID